MRTLSSQIQVQKNRKDGARPFITVVFNFDASRGGALHLTERQLRELGDPIIIGSNIHYPVIKSFGRFGSARGRGPEGQLDVQAIEMTITNAPSVLPGGRFSDYFYSAFKQVIVDFYINFLADDETTIYQFLRASGVAQSPTKYSYSEVNLRVTALKDRWCNKSVLRSVTITRFPNAPSSSLGKGIPIAIGTSDGARIPMVNLDSTAEYNGVRQSKYSIENPSEMPVSSIDALYWNGHEIIEDDISVSVDEDVSETVPLKPIYDRAFHVWHRYPGSRFGRGVDPFFEPYDDETIEIGRSHRIGFGTGDKGVLNLIQPVKWLDDVRIPSATMTALKVDLYNRDPSLNTLGDIPPLRNLVVEIMDEDMLKMWGGTGSPPLDAVPNAFKNIGQSHFTRRASAQQLDPASFDINQPGTNSQFADLSFFPVAHADTWFDFHEFTPVPGKQYYAAIYIPNDIGGVPIDPNNQFYVIKRDANVEVNDDEGRVELGEAFTIGREQIANPSGGFPATQQAYYQHSIGSSIGIGFHAIVTGKGTGIDTEEFDSSTGGALGSFHIMVQPDAARVIGGVSIQVKKEVPPGASLSTQVTLKGSVTIKVFEIDANGFLIDELASAQFDAKDFDSVVTTTEWTEIFRYLSAPVLMLEDKHYALAVEGQLDESGEYSGWMCRSATDAAYFGAASIPMSYSSEPHVLWIGGPQRVTTSFNDEVGFVITLHAVKFRKNLSDTDPDGHPVATVQAYLKDVLEFEVPEGTTIGVDVTVAKTRPDEVIHALLNRAGVPDARIDLAGTFAAAATFYGTTYKLQGAVIDQQTYTTLLARLAFECRSSFDWEDAKAQLKILPDATFSPVRTLSLSDVLPRSLRDLHPAVEVTETEAHDIVNLINLLYRRNYSVGRGSDAYFGAGSFANATSIDAEAYGPLEKPELFWCDYIRSEAMAAVVGFFYLVLHSIPRRTVSLPTKLQTLELEKQDVIGLDLDEYAGAAESGEALGAGPLGSSALGGTGKFNGFGDVPMVIEAATIDWSSKRIEFLVRDR